MSFLSEKEQKGLNKFLELRNTDSSFAKIYPNTGEAFDEWYKDVYLNPQKWWTSSLGHIELQMTLEQANTTNDSEDCQDDCVALLNSPNIKEQLDKYTPEIIKQVVDEYTDWDDSYWKEEIERGELTIEDVYRIRLLWIAGEDISDNED